MKHSCLPWRALSNSSARAVRAVLLFCLGFTAALVTACAQGVGEGEVQSDQLYLRNCWNGPFKLGPNFFGANPFSTDVMSIRVQRGDDNQEVSDGLNVMVSDVQNIRRNELGSEIDVGLPAGVTPPGMPLQLKENPPTVSLTLYLQDTCHLQNGTIYSINGKIKFERLFSGNANETNGDDRLTQASFDATFADPRDMNSEYEFAPEVTSHVTGWFKFYFQRGQPAQPFP